MLKRVLVLVLLCGSASAAAQPTILVMGDSLSAAYGMTPREGWTTLLEQRLNEQGYPHKVINSSISGETTAGGLSRMPNALKVAKPAIVLIELGANDGLRGLSLKQMRANLSKLIDLSRKAGAKVLLFEMRIPPNYGPQYVGEFQRSFTQLANEKKVTLVPFFLAKTAGNDKYLQRDGLHPNVLAQPLMLEAVWPVLEPAVSASANHAPGGSG